MRVLSIAAVAAVSAIAFAQYASAAPPPILYSWTGFYAGGNIGYGWGSGQTDTAGSGSTIAFPGVLPITNNFAFGGDHKSAFDGVVGGGQIGYNYQYDERWVLGFEVDFQGSAQRGSNAFANSIAGPLCDTAAPGPTCTATSPLNGTAVTGYEAKIDWFGTVRGRLGWLATDQTLLYVTGGLAYGHVSVSGNLNVSAADTAIGSTFGPSTSAFSASKTKIGFAVGGGIEGKFAGWLPPSWTWKVEYLYVDLGSLDTSTSFAAISNTPAGYTPLAGTMTTHTRLTDNIVRVGFNYQFGH